MFNVPRKPRALFVLESFTIRSNVSSSLFNWNAPCKYDSRYGLNLDVSVEIAFLDNIAFSIPGSDTRIENGIWYVSSLFFVFVI